MADKSMKAVIWAEVDPRGVQQGVAAANRSLDSLNRTAARTAGAASMSAALSAAQSGYSVLQNVLGAVDRRISELYDLSNKYSGSAAGAAAQTRADQIRASVQIANAVAPGAIAMSRAKSDVLLGGADRISRDASGISDGMGAFGRFKENAGAIATILSEGAAKAIGAYETLLGGNISGGLAQGFAASGATLNELFTSSNYAYQQSGDTRGMPYDQQQTEYLKQIAASLKGGK